MKNTIVGLGEILWDVFPERKVLGGERLPILPIISPNLDSKAML